MAKESGNIIQKPSGCHLKDNASKSAANSKPNQKERVFIIVKFLFYSIVSLRYCRQIGCLGGIDMTRLTFTYETIIEAPIDETWTFFSTADNLARMTTFPKVSIQSNPVTATGNLIKMELKVAGFSIEWHSLIEEVKPQHFFY